MFPARVLRQFIPKPYPGSGVAMRPNNNLAIYKRTRNARPYRNVYIEPGIIIYNLPDTENLILRTIAIRYRSVKLRPKLRITNYAFKISLPQSACAVVLLLFTKQSRLLRSFLQTAVSISFLLLYIVSSLKSIVSVARLGLILVSLTPAALNIRLEAFTIGVSAYLSLI